MPLHIKNWKKFQHFKDRRPPWVKLYRDLLDDPEWHQLEPHAAKTLVMLWLLASEYDGQLPDAKTIAFRLRTSVLDVESALPLLSHWVVDGDIEPISDGYHDGPPETERETEKRQRQTERAEEFQRWYALYPKKEGRAKAEEAFAKVKEPVDLLIAALKRHCQRPDWLKEEGRYIPLPATWLNQRRWEDQGTTVAAPASRHTDSAEETRRMLAAKDKGTTAMPAEIRQFAAQLTGRKAA